MKYLGMNEYGENITFDARKEDVMGERIFEFVLKQRDYFYSYNCIWDTFLGEYLFNVNGKRFILPSGTYVYCVSECGSSDWLLTDELIGRGIEVLTLDKEFSKWEINILEFENIAESVLFMPTTKNVIPVSDLTGTSVILIAYHDLYHNMKEMDFADFIVQ